MVFLCLLLFRAMNCSVTRACPFTCGPRDHVALCVAIPCLTVIVASPCLNASPCSCQCYSLSQCYCVASPCLNAIPCLSIISTDRPVITDIVVDIATFDNLHRGCAHVSSTSSSFSTMIGRTCFNHHTNNHAPLSSLAALASSFFGFALRRSLDAHTHTHTLLMMRSGTVCQSSTYDTTFITWCVCIYIYIYIYVSLSLYIHIYIYIYIHMLSRGVRLMHSCKYSYADIVLTLTCAAYKDSGGCLTKTNTNKHME